jgi:IS30 family transposase
MLVKVPWENMVDVVTVSSEKIRHPPAALRRSFTWDRCMELAQHK